MTEESCHDSDEPLVLALAEGMRHAEAARRAGVVQRRLRESAFVTRVQEARAQLVAEVRGALMGATTKAVRVLEAMLEEESPSIRLGAARGLLDSFVKFQGIEGLSERVTRLESEHRPLAQYTTEQIKRMREQALIAMAKDGRFPNLNGNVAATKDTENPGIR